MIAGITGHQNLDGEETIEWVKNKIIKNIDDYTITKGCTSLAIGADQLYAEVLLLKKIPYVAIIPCKQYEKTFQEERHLKNYRMLVKEACEIVELDYGKPSEAAFYDAGKRVVDISDLIIAIWNGKKAKGLGGTGDIVTYAISKKRPIVHINPFTRVITKT